MILRTKLEFKGNNKKIDFPCTEQILKEKLAILYLPENLFKNLVVNEVIEPEWLKVLEKQSVSMDQLNYLAKRLDVLSDNQCKKFEAAMKYLKLTEIKDLINLTFNLSNNEEEYAEVYNGRTFPQFIYEDCLAVVEMKYGEDTEYLYFPCEDVEIFKAQMRLNVFHIENCENEILETSLRGKMKKRFEETFKKSGLYEANEVVKLAELLLASGNSEIDTTEEIVTPVMAGP